MSDHYAVYLKLIYNNNNEYQFQLKMKIIKSNDYSRPRHQKKLWFGRGRETSGWKDGKIYSLVQVANISQVYRHALLPSSLHSHNACLYHAFSWGTLSLPRMTNHLYLPGMAPMFQETCQCLVNWYTLNTVIGHPKHTRNKCQWEPGNHTL